MASAAKRYCLQPGCPVLVTSGRCPAHARSTPTARGWRSRPAITAKRLSGRRLQRERARLFAEHPFFEACGKRVSEIRDHMVPLAEGGTDDDSNIAALCRECSNAKTRAESARGRERAR